MHASTFVQLRLKLDVLLVILSQHKTLLDNILPGIHYLWLDNLTSFYLVNPARVALYCWYLFYHSTTRYHNRFRLILGIFFDHSAPIEVIIHVLRFNLMLLQDIKWAYFFLTVAMPFILFRLLD